MRIAPQLARYHPQVHDIVLTLAARDRRATGTLVGLAQADGWDDPAP